MTYKTEFYGKSDIYIDTRSLENELYRDNIDFGLNTLEKYDYEPEPDEDHEEKSLIEIPELRALPELKPQNVSIESRIDSIRQVIQEVREEIDKRISLCRDIISEIDEQIRAVRALLTITPASGDLAATQRRIHLERELSALMRERREHRLRAFTEILWLKRELRELRIRFGWYGAVFETEADIWKEDR